jgi:hypothetical protein
MQVPLSHALRLALAVGLAAWAGTKLAGCAAFGSRQWGETCEERLGFTVPDSNCSNVSGKSLDCLPVSCDGEEPRRDRCVERPKQRTDGSLFCEDRAAVCGFFTSSSLDPTCFPAALCDREPNRECPLEDPSQPRPDTGETDTEGRTAATGVTSGTGSGP